jgi:nucleoside-diphosphate-sugar epimerase
VLGLQRHDKILRSKTSDEESYKKYFDRTPDEIYYGDIKDKEVIEKVVAGADYVINLAGILGTSETINNPYPAVEVNILGTLNVLEACRIWKRPFVQIAVGNHWMNNTYSITRTTAERFTLMYAKEHGLKANVIRALNAYGPRQTFASYKKIIPSFVLAALQNKPLMINGDGEQVMDMIYVEDLANCLVSTLLNPVEMAYLMQTTVPGATISTFPEVHGNIYQCGQGSDAMTVNQIAKLVIKLTKSKSKIVHKDMRAGEPTHAKVVADYRSPYYETLLEDGLKKTIEYYRENLDFYI